MKFWQLTSIFRSEKEMLTKEFKTPKGEPYGLFYADIAGIVARREVKILNSIVDDDFVRQVCKNSNKKLYYSSSLGLLFSYDNDFVDKIIPIAKAIELFEHDAIEETFEKSQAKVGSVGKLSD